ncbi:hypothetical protein PIB30_078191 [Stylosanthes scabra]|uniref:Uncharacterized protein n=1 Tax=Stylosanthes scabra TaxID=79078 RepID=A0ABU6SSX0_9FABA|nr:hypothetical protein [Stylosanthes scabra]
MGCADILEVPFPTAKVADGTGRFFEGRLGTSSSVWCFSCSFQIASDKPSPSTKGNAKAYGPPTRASPRFAALRSQSVANPRPETPVIPAVIAPTPSLPPKKRPIRKVAAPKEQEVIAISSDSEPEPEIVEKDEDVEEDPEEDPDEAPQDAGMEEEEEEENPKEDPKEENAAEEGVREEDDFADY